MSKVYQLLAFVGGVIALVLYGKAQGKKEAVHDRLEQDLKEDKDTYTKTAQTLKEEMVEISIPKKPDDKITKHTVDI